MALQQTASKLLSKYGEAVSLTYQDGGQVDPVTGEVIVSPSLMLVDGFGYPSKYKANEVNGTSIESGDIRLVLELVSERPQVGWKAVVDGAEYRVMDVNPIRRTGQDIIYICQLRKN